jgi:SlyX protein
MPQPIDEPHDLEARFLRLEVQLAHTQHLVDQLNLVITQQAEKLDRLSRSYRKLQESFEDLKSKSEDKRDLLDEKPPHY